MREGLYETRYLQICNSGETALTATTHYPASASYIDVSKYRRFAFVFLMGALNSDLTVQLQQDTSATQTASIESLGASFAIANTDDNKIHIAEVDAAAMDTNNKFRYVNAYITGATGSDDFAAILFIGWLAREVPVTQSATALPAANVHLIAG